jgi:peptidoglycan hydrolase CwlO-like protein
MRLLKLIAPFVALAVAILQLLLDHKWQDKSAKQFRRARVVLFILVVIIAAIVSGVIIYDDDAGSKNLSMNLKDIKEQNDSLITSVESANNKISDLKSTLEPFRKIAERQYGDIPESEALSKLA